MEKTFSEEGLALFCVEYDLPTNRGHVLAEGDHGDRWSVNPDHASLHNISLEDEIHMLRRRMEQIFWKKNHLLLILLLKSAVCWTSKLTNT